MCFKMSTTTHLALGATKDVQDLSEDLIRGIGVRHVDGSEGKPKTPCAQYTDPIRSVTNRNETVLKV